VLFGPRQGWQQHRRKQGDDSNDDQQLDQRKSVIIA
jgi:hypothetical protein